MSGKEYSAGVKVTVRKDGTGFFGPGIAELMERIAECGSLKEACRRMGLSYSKGRYILKRAEALWGCPLIAMQHGGSGGGACVLTEEGRTLLEAFRRMEEKIRRDAEQHFLEFAREARPARG